MQTIIPHSASSNHDAMSASLVPCYRSKACTICIALPFCGYLFYCNLCLSRGLQQANAMLKGVPSVSPLLGPPDGSGGAARTPVAGAFDGQLPKSLTSTLEYIVGQARRSHAASSYIHTVPPYSACTNHVEQPLAGALSQILQRTETRCFGNSV